MLTDLQVDGNQLSVIFSDIRNLTALTELNVASNAMSSLQMGKQSYTRNFGYIYKRMSVKC